MVVADTLKHRSLPFGALPEYSKKIEGVLLLNFLWQSVLTLVDYVYNYPLSLLSLTFSVIPYHVQSLDLLA